MLNKQKTKREMKRKQEQRKAFLKKVFNFGKKEDKESNIETIFHYI